MKRRILAWLLTLMMAFSCCPVSALAGEMDADASAEAVETEETPAASLSELEIAAPEEPEITETDVEEETTDADDPALPESVEDGDLDVPEEASEEDTPAILEEATLTALKLGASTVASGTCGDNLTWTLDSNGLLTISGSGAMKDYLNYNSAPWYSQRSSVKSVTIPDSVTSIGDRAFYGCDGLTSVTIPDSVTSIGDYAFYNCSGLTSITIPDSVTSIGEYAFSGCRGLTSVTIPDSVTSIGKDAFYNTAYYNDNSNWIDGILYIGHWVIDAESDLSGNCVIPDSVTSIGDGAFYDCSGLTSVTIPDSVTSIGDYAFYNCSSLTAFTVAADNPNYSSQDGVLFNKAKTKLIQYPAGNTGTSYTIPDSVTTIGDYAFEYCSGLTSVTIPDSVTSIGDWAFSGCSDLTSVTIPDSVTSIGGHTFSGCSGLTSVTIPDSVTSIGEYAFSGCRGLTSVTIPDSVTSIGDWAFRDCSGLTSVTIPDSVTSIGEYAFSGCRGLKSMTLPFVGYKVPSASDTYQYPFGYIFGGSSYTGGVATTQSYHVNSTNNTTYSTYYIPATLKSVTITGGTLPYGAFSGCSGLTSIAIPNGVTGIGSYAFYDCSGLTSVTIPDSVTSIGDYAFSGCSGLTSVTIPDSVTSIGERAFYDCSGLKSVTIGNGVTSIGGHAFYKCSGLTSITIPDSVTSIGSGAFSGCSNLTSVTIGDGVIGIGRDAFYDCSGLTSVTIPDSVTSIGNNAFAYCSGLTSITIGNSVTSIGDYAFSGCSGLTSVTIPDSVTSIGSGAFSGCNSLESITLPFVGDKVHSANDFYQYPFGYIFGKSSYTGGVATKQYYYGNSTYSTTYDTFYIPTSLKSVSITGGELLYGAFYNCSGLTSIAIPNGVTGIGSYAFYDCSGLTSVTIPDSVTSIGSGAFSGCNGLKSMTLPFVGDKVHSASDTYHPFGYIFGGSSYTGGVATKQYYYGNSTTGTTSNTYYIPASLKSVTITGGTIPYGAFYNCSGLTTVTIGDSVTSIDHYAFYNCSGLTSVTIPDGVTSISSYAFSGCNKLSTIYAMKNSYAEAWAKNAGYSVIAQEIPVTAVTLPKSEMTLFIGGSQKLIPAIEPLHCTDDVIWKSAANTIVSVDSDGTIHGIDFGTTTIKVIVGEFSAACKVTVVQPVTSISLNQTNLTLDVTKTYQLTATVYPDDANNPGYEWSVDDPTVASVSETGLVTALKGGTTTVTATAVDGSGVAGTCTVTVIQSVVSIDLNKTSITLDATKTYQLEATVNPSEASNKKIEWSVDDPTIATVSKTGFITALKRGTTTVTATAVDGSGVSKSCTVIVLQPVTSISLNKTSLTLDATQTYQLTATVYPGDANNPKYEWSVINPTIATVSEDGLVTALSKGTTIVTASALDGSNVIKSCTITVEGYAVSDVSAFESPHSYANNCDDFWVYTVPDAGELKVTFDSRTSVEDGFDFLYIYDGSGQQIGKYTGTELAGKTISVTGDTVKIKLVSDGSGNEWGFKVSDVASVAKALASISLKTKPTKLSYLEGKDTLSVTGGKVTLHYNNGTTEDITLTAAMVSGFDNTKVGKQTLTVTYEGKTCTFDVTVVAKSLESISMKATPTKLNYLEGKDTLNVTGGMVTLHYNNDTTADIDLTAAMVSGFDNTKVGKQTLTVTYGGKTCAFEVTIVAKSLESISLKKAPATLSYLESKDTLNVTGGKVTLHYNNGTTEDIDLTAAMVSGFDNTKIGAQTLTVTYGGKTCTFEVTILAKSLESISLKTKPTKLSYLEGKDTLSVTGGKVTLHYNNGATEDIDLTAAMVSGFDNTKIGAQTLTVTYGGKTCAFDVTVVAKSLASISMKATPTTLSYLEGKDMLNVSGGKVTLHYNNGTSEDIDLTAAMVSGFDNTKVGTQTLTVTYQGKTCTFDEVVVLVGDLNSDGVPSVTDMQTLYDYLSAGILPSAGVSYCDINGDNAVNILDYQALYEMVKK